MYIGEFLDPHGNKVELKFPASVVTKHIPSIARGSYSEIRKYETIKYLKYVNS